MNKVKVIDNLKRYRFELRHLTVIFIIIIFFQIILSVIQKQSLQSFLEDTQKWYQQNSAENLAHLTTTSLELLLENINIRKISSEYEEHKIIQSFNIIFNQQLLEKKIEDICLIVSVNNNDYAISDGKVLYNFLRQSKLVEYNEEEDHEIALENYEKIKDEIRSDERVFSIIENEAIFHTYVPFVPNGDFQGVLYIRKNANFENLTGEIISSYEEVAIIFSSLILFGLLAMYYISSFTVRERDQVQEQLFEEKQEHLKEQIIHDKESLFTRRIYHTHHKAEKVMGFIKEDIRSLQNEIKDKDEVMERITKYSNFISRVIYDMKWYEPPIHSIRGQMFDTNLNELLDFLVKHIFLRISSKTDSFHFNLQFDEKLPTVQINQFVIWEIFEPLIQNCIDHGKIDKIQIKINTSFNQETNESVIQISDNGKGINEGLLKLDEKGVKNIFSENVTTKTFEDHNTGYGCYIAYEIAVKRCGWKLDAKNLPDGGAQYEIIIKH
jgi:signal transduction histidine kinase